jgi:archaeal type IV pilus assembly protein PilA
MKTLLRKDEQAVSPVIATILMVAITVVLAAVLYVMVSGLISGPGGTPTAWGVNIGKSGDQTNWTLTFTSIPTSTATSSAFITIRNAAGAPVSGATNVPFSTITATGYHAMYFSPNNAGVVSTGDVLRLSAVSYPTGYQVQIVSGTSVVYTHALQ